MQTHSTHHHKPQPSPSKGPHLRTGPTSPTAQTARFPEPSKPAILPRKSYHQAQSAIWLHNNPGSARPFLSVPTQD
ncbi:hypothetical protein CKAH01_07382 [Colletotrichum kahawae]|uniref:Uncharacterized protein n=1 Tax=Colletotrichum kahawae TaxID=34407 RepID=A0AAD9Y657_COLKA|nr:hypothetical protein CKAH01_07382 [Colletotrichum kahawae]